PAAPDRRRALRDRRGSGRPGAGGHCGCSPGSGRRAGGGVTMRTRDYYQTEVVTAPLDATATDLAERMGGYAVGSVVLVDAQRRPVGIVTDRDLTCRAIAREAVPGNVRAADLMSQPLVTASADEPIEGIVERVRAAAVRRVVVLRDERISGLVTIDDLVVEL